MKRIQKIISAILVLALLISAVPIEVFAVRQEDMLDEEMLVEEPETLENEEEATPIETASIVGENLEKRDRYQKEFYLDNGTNLIVVYPEPVHYESDEGWEEIDNTLISTTTKGVNMLTNTAGDWTVNLPQSMSSTAPVMVSQDGYTLGFALENKSSGSALSAVKETMNVSAAEIKDVSLTSTEIEQLTYPEATVDTLNSRVEYAEVFDDVDIRYDLSSEMLKESIMINEKPTSQQSYIFNVAVDKLSLAIQEDGSIWAMATDKTSSEPEFVIAAPYMVDANGELCDDVETTLTAVTTGAYKLTYTPSHSWLVAAERAYPVALDPTVEAELNINNIMDRTIASVSEAYVYDDDYLYIGNRKINNVNNKLRTYLMYKDLPKLTSADVIVNATVMIANYDTYSAQYHQINVHEVMGEWNSVNLNWANQPGYDPIPTDYETITYQAWHQWDVTEIAQGWYKDGGQWEDSVTYPHGTTDNYVANRGMMFKMTDAIENGTTQRYTKFISSDYSTDDTLMPHLYITYVNNSGLEGYWDYHTQSAGRAGTGYVNDFTGNLIWVHNDMGYSGNLAPVSINHVYNANDKDNNDFQLGYGWRTNYNQLVYRADVKDTADKYYYVWEDEDGTRHYFKYSKNVTGGEEYEDESGVELTLTVVTSPAAGKPKYKLKDKDGNTSYFDTEGRLTRIEQHATSTAQENDESKRTAINITYTAAGSKCISTITDGAGRKYKFNYNEAFGIMHELQYLGTGTEVLEQMRFSYDNKNLHYITYNDGQHTVWKYYDNHLMQSAADVDGYTLTYDYNTTEGYLPNRVNKIEESDVGDDPIIIEDDSIIATPGGSLEIEYNVNETTFTDHTGRKEIYQFNYYGNTIAIQNDEGQAVYATYARNDAGSSGKANQLTLSSKLQNTVKNYVYNSSFEESEYWSKAEDGTAEYNPTNSYLGSKSMKLSCTTADMSVIIRPKNNWQYVTATAAGETYTFSAYVKTESLNGGKVTLQITNSGGTALATSEPLDEVSEWTRLQVSYTTTAANQVLKYAVVLDGIGTAYADCLQFEKMPTASRYNLIQNGDFSYAGTAATDALGWTQPESDVVSSRLNVSTATEPITSETAAPQLDDYVYSITGNVVSTEAKPTRKIRHEQDVILSGAEGDVYTLAGWAIADAAPRTDNYRKFALLIQFYSTTSSTSASQSEYVYFNEDVGSENNWQYAAGQIVAKQAYAKIKVSLAYEYNFNIAYFDGIQLFKEEFGHSYVYDEDGNVISVTDLQQSKTEYEYSNNNLTSMVIDDGTTSKPTYTYEYDDYHNVTEAKSATGVTNTFEYNDHGLNTSVSIIDSKNTSNTLKITARAAYTENGNFMASQTDTMGNVTTYDYNYKENDDDDGDNGDRSLLRSVTVGTEENPSITRYTYDDRNRTETVENGDSKVRYVYDDDYLTTITHRNTYNAATDTGLNTIYQFEYGNFGLLNKVIVGDDDESTVDEVEETALITHEYNTKDQGFTLAKSTYGNGHSVAYAYDDQFRTKSITYDDGITTTPPVLAVEYEYDNNGNLGVLKDHLGNRTVKYLYDAADRLMKVQSQYLTVGWEYDDLNNLTQQKYTVDESYFTYNLRGKADVVTGYTYDKDNRPTKITSQVTDKNNTYNAGLVSANYTYDGYGRNNVTTYKHGADTTVLTRTIGYVNPSSTTTTNVISTLNNHTNLYDKTYTYTYDAQGNITSISDGTDTITYVYDELNQLVRENNPTLGENGETWVYTYDLGGNITSKTKYDYTTAANPTGGTVIRYEYTNENWPDLLTKYNGKTITSDAIGNMLSDGTWTYTWQNGRQLAGMSKSDTSISYTYDSDGMRTSKTVNGTTTKYMYHGGQLVAMDTEFGPVYFHYDSTGVMAMEVQGTMLYYIKNAQGDIVALVDTNGYPVVEYSYDAWGNILNIDGLYATTYGIYNPFRYRSYVYDDETGLYYLQTRYHSPELGRFINGDQQLNTYNLLGYNMFSYCFNNPLMFTDSLGMAPEWWQWVISGTMVITGVVLIATGVGGIAGGVLLSAGANSIIGSYVSEASGGSSVAGWVGGMVTGALCGTGAGIAGELMIKASSAVGATCIGNVAASGVTSFGFGTAGAFLGQNISATIDGKQLNQEEVIYSSLTTGAINCFSGIGAGVVNAVNSPPVINTTSRATVSSFVTAVSVFVEMICDFFGNLFG